MDLARGARRIVVMMRHNTPGGEPKLVEHCTFPLTASKVVSRVYTELGIFDPKGDHFAVRALAKDVDIAAVRVRSGAALVVEETVVELPRPHLGAEREGAVR